MPLLEFFNPNNNLPSTAIHSSQFTDLLGSNNQLLPTIMPYFCNHFRASISSLFHSATSE